MLPFLGLLSVQYAHEYRRSRGVLPQEVPQEPSLVRLVEDVVALLEPCELAVLSQDPVRERVERVDPSPSQILFAVQVEYRCCSLGHLLRRLVAEGHAHDLLGGDPLAQQVSVPPHERLRLARADPRQNQQGTILVPNGLALLGVEFAKQLVKFLGS